MSIAIYPITSPLHDERAVAGTTRAFLGSLGLEDALCHDFETFGNHALNLIFVRTGGTEGVFKQLLPVIESKSPHPIYLLASHTGNSLAASMEILSFLNQQDIKGEIIHGEATYVTQRIATLARVNEARAALRGKRLGIIGAPSDWLISSLVSPGAVMTKLGIELVNIDMQRLIDLINKVPADAPAELIEKAPSAPIAKSLGGATAIYNALKVLIEEERLSGLTIRCFDLLTAVRNTGCLALARLNSEGIVAGCEGDVPAMLSMAIAQAVVGHTGFQANPATITPTTGEMLLAHCTIPLNMVDRYELDTHFESGIGVGIRGYMATGPVTLFKVAGDLTRHFVAQGTLVRNQAEPDLCRTQQIIALDDASLARNYFLTCPIGNHHIVLQGHQAAVLNDFMTL